MIFYIVLILLLILIPSKLFIHGFNKQYMNRDSTASVNCVFILLIFASHFSQTIPAYTSRLDTLYWSVRIFLNQLVVTTFLFYSGFGIVESIKKQGFQYIEEMPAKRILKTWLIWDIAQILYFIFTTCLGNRYEVKYIVSSFFALESFGSGSWYFFVILCLYIITWIAFRAYREDWIKASIFITISSIILICFIKFYLKKGTWWYDTALCYSLGIWYSLFKEKWEKYIFNNNSRYLCILGTTSLTFFILGILVKKTSSVILHELGACVFVILIVLFTMKFQFRSPILKWGGLRLSSLYLMHRFPMIFFSKIAILENIYIRFAACVIVAFLLAYFFDKIIHQVNRLVFNFQKIIHIGLTIDKAN